MKNNKIKKKTVKIVSIRPDGLKRVYSNHIEITKNPSEVDIRFCDIKPPTNDDAINKVKKNNMITTAIEAEIIIPLEVAKNLAKALSKLVN